MIVAVKCGLAVWSGSVTPFADQESSGEGESVKFTGKDLDAATGLYYFNARWYDAGTGRFISEDPMRDGANWYVYVGNNPLGFVDPSGLVSIDGAVASSAGHDVATNGYTGSNSGSNYTGGSNTVNMTQGVFYREPVVAAVNKIKKIPPEKRASPLYNSEYSPNKIIPNDHTYIQTHFDKRYGFFHEKGSQSCLTVALINHYIRYTPNGLSIKALDKAVSLAVANGWLAEDGHPLDFNNFSNALANAMGRSTYFSWVYSNGKEVNRTPEEGLRGYPAGIATLYKRTTIKEYFHYVALPGGDSSGYLDSLPANRAGVGDYRMINIRLLQLLPTGWRAR